MKKIEYLSANSHIIKNKKILDLACHDGESTSIIQNLGADHIFAVEIRDHLIKKAQQRISGNVDFYQGDITDFNLINPLVNQSQTVMLLGVFYHLFDHFRFMSTILKPNIEHCLIETVCGSESLNPEMYWGFEETDSDFNGRFADYDRIPNGTPNTVWIVESAKIFGFDCDWIHYYGNKQKKKLANITHEEYAIVSGPDWPPYHELVTGQNIPSFVRDELEQMLVDYTDRRMILRLYNKNTINSTPLDLKRIYKWPL